jgi:hypothetical protein
MNITWKGTTGNYALGSNWIGGIAPGSTDDAVFDASGKTKTVTIVNNETVGGWTFKSGHYTIDITGANLAIVNIDGAGIVGSPIIKFDETRVNSGAGTLEFNGHSSAGNATLDIVNGGVSFNGNSDGGHAQVIVGAYGIAYFSSRGPLGDGVVHVGSIGGPGTIQADSDVKDLIVGSNNLSTVCSGGDNQAGETQLTKVGTGTLLFTDRTLFAGYTIDGGTLGLDNEDANYGEITFGHGAASRPCSSMRHRSA